MTVMAEHSPKPMYSSVHEQWNVDQMCSWSQAPRPRHACQLIYHNLKPAEVSKSFYHDSFALGVIIQICDRMHWQHTYIMYLRVKVDKSDSIKLTEGATYIKP